MSLQSNLNKAKPLISIGTPPLSNCVGQQSAFDIPNRTTRTVVKWYRKKLDPLRRASPLHKDNEHFKESK